MLYVEFGFMRINSLIVVWVYFREPTQVVALGMNIRGDLERDPER
jgi:hypothetical protein